MIFLHRMYEILIHNLSIRKTSDLFDLVIQEYIKRENQAYQKSKAMSQLAIQLDLQFEN